MGKSTAQTEPETIESPTVYSFQELVDAAEAAFQTRPEVVVVALKTKGLTEATKEEAQQAIDEFMNKEV